MKRFALSVATISTSFISGTLFAADALTIRDIAPAGALLVIGADDIRGTIDRLGPTAYGKLWNDPSAAEQVKLLKEDFEKAMTEAAAEAGIDRDAITWPASVGVAVMGGLDEELGIPQMHLMFFCDWASEAEQTTKMVDALVAQIEKGAKERGETVKAEEIRGRRAIGFARGEGADGADGGDGMGEGEDPMEDPGFGAGPDFGLDEMYFVSDKGRLFAASSVEMMDTLLGRADGERAKSIGETETFKGATALAGGTQDIYAVLSTEAAGPLLDTMPEVMLARPLITRFFGDIKAWSFGVHAKDGVLELGQGIYVPGDKVGLLSLIDLSTEPKAPPAIVPSDAVTYGRMNVRFDKVMAMIDEAIAGLPAEQGEMIKPQLDLYRPAMQSAFGAMGPEMHMWGVDAPAEDPMAATSMFAIAMKNDKDSARAVMDFINLLPLGLQSRDFNGMTIMSDEFSPVAIGIGGGYMMIGSVKQVEQSLRAVDAKGEAGLAADEQFKKGMGLMSKSPVVGMAWWNTAKYMESQVRLMETMTGQMGGMVGADGEEEVLGVGMEEVGEFWDLMKPEVIKRCFGDTTLEFASVKSGFSTMYRFHPAAAK